jgi:hypothetical protein
VRVHPCLAATAAAAAALCSLTFTRAPSFLEAALRLPFLSPEPCLVINFYPKFYYAKRRFSLYQNISTCMEY